MLAGMGLYSIRSLGVTNGYTENIGENFLPSVYYAGKIDTDTSDYRRHQLQHVIATTQEEMNEIENKLSDDSARIEENINAYMELISDDAERELFNTIKSEWDNYVELNDQIVALSRAMQSDSAMALQKGEAQDSFDKLTALVDELVTYNQKNANEAVEKAAANYSSTRMILVAVIILAIIICIGAAWIITRSITTPINKLIGVADALAIGDVNVNVDTNLNDEIGKLMKSFEKMILSVRNQALVTEKIADGDLTVEVEVRSKDDLLGQKLSEMVDKNNEILTNIANASEQVAAGSKQISDSSVSLSQGATEQASSIEQLTASLEEISSQTKLSAENANKANELAANTKSNAEQGNSQMGGMLKAMEDISEASENISNIIKVIDDIAFQTNILALNAAVEAARAGQHGKGFAVVAEEVRNLAARSAEAAKETTAMIKNSIKKSEHGTAIAKDTAEALNSIVKDIDDVANLVKEISVASNEQATGISQINQGIMLVSQVVQTNSATSEESAAASEELSSQALSLREQVGMFKLKKESYSYQRLEMKEQEMLQGAQYGERKEESTKFKSETINLFNDNSFDKY